MYRVQSTEIVSLLESKAQEFADFVCDIIRESISYAKGSHIAATTHQKVNRPDGGVDAACHNPMLELDSQLDVPTVWQFKATESLDQRGIEDELAPINDETGRREARPFIRERIDQGYQYVLCYLDSPDDRTLERLQGIIDQLLASYHQCQKPGLLISAATLAQWANKYTGLILKYFRPSLCGKHLVAVSQKREDFLEHVPYKRDSTRRRIAKNLEHHVEFTLEPSSSDKLMYLVGYPGVGKTRFVCEELAGSEIETPSAIYAGNIESAACYINWFMHEPKDRRAVLVVDEATYEFVHEHRDFIRHNSDRLRVIVIVNEFAHEYELEAPNFLKNLPEEQAVEALKEKYSRLTDTSIRHVYRQTEGYMDMTVWCAESLLGDPGPVVFMQRIESLLGSDGMIVLQALSLFIKVGYYEDVANELIAVCRFCDINEAVFREKCDEIERTTGFVRKLQRYYHVSPEILANNVHDHAWQKWCRDRLSTRLIALPDSLQESLIKRVERSGSAQAKEEIARFFEEWFSSKDFRALLNLDDVDILCGLVRTSPDTYLPRLRRLIESAPAQNLIFDGSSVSGRFNPRRYLVFLLDECVAHKEYFSEAERCLRRLALGEAEPELGNNATVSWKMLWRPVLSGTEVDFDTRFGLWIQLTRSDDAELSELALEAGIEAVTSSSYMSKFIRHTSLGRPHPDEWQPRTTQEQYLCTRRIAEHLLELARDSSYPLAAKLQTTITSDLRGFLHYIPPDKLRSALVLNTSDIQSAINVVRQLDSIFEVEKLPPKVLDDLRLWHAELTGGDVLGQWHAELTGGDVLGQLVGFLGRDAWRYFSEPESSEVESQSKLLAEALLSSHLGLESFLNLLTGPNANELTLQLGKAIAQADTELTWLVPMCEATAINGQPFLLRGYAQVAAETEEGIRLILGIIERLENAYFWLVYDLVHLLGKKVDGPLWLVRWVESAILKPGWLRTLWPLGGNETSDDDLVRVLDAVEGRLPKEPDYVLDVIDLLQMFLHGRKSPLGTELATHVRSACEFYVRYADSLPGRDDYGWGQLVKSQIEDYKWSIPLLTIAAATGTYSLQETASEILKDYAKTQCALILRSVQPIVESKETITRFYFSNFGKLLSEMPAREVMQWAEALNDLARAFVARQLPKPFGDEEGKTVVPELSRAFLERFGSDDKVKLEATCAWATFGAMRIQDGTFEDIALLFDGLKDDECQAIRDIAEHLARRFREDEKRHRRVEEELQFEL